MTTTDLVSISFPDRGKGRKEGLGTRLYLKYDDSKTDQYEQQVLVGAHTVCKQSKTGGKTWKRGYTLTSYNRLLL